MEIVFRITKHMTGPAGAHDWKDMPYMTHNRGIKERFCEAGGLPKKNHCERAKRIAERSTDDANLGCIETPEARSWAGQVLSSSTRLLTRATVWPRDPHGPSWRLPLGLFLNDLKRLSTVPVLAPSRATLS